MLKPWVIIGVPYIGQHCESFTVRVTVYSRTQVGYTMGCSVTLWREYVTSIGCDSVPAPQSAAAPSTRLQFLLPSFSLSSLSRLALPRWCWQHCYPATGEVRAPHASTTATSLYLCFPVRSWTNKVQVCLQMYTQSHEFCFVICTYCICINKYIIIYSYTHLI